MTIALDYSLMAWMQSRYLYWMLAILVRLAATSSVIAPVIYIRALVAWLYKSKALSS